MKKIGEIKGIPVVEGNINEVNKNQIHYKENNGNIQLSKRGNDNKLNSVTSSSGGVGISTDSFLYLKNVAAIKDADGIVVLYPFYRGLNKIHPLPGESIQTKQVYFTTVDEENYGMHAVEIFKVKDLTCVVDDGISIKIDTTSYNSYIESIVNSYISSGLEFSKEEMITMMKSKVVEITKEEFEELWNNYN